MQILTAVERPEAVCDWLVESRTQERVGYQGLSVGAQVREWFAFHICMFLSFGLFDGAL